MTRMERMKPFDAETRVKVLHEAPKREAARESRELLPR